jgi:hypothetical protein
MDLALTNVQESLRIKRHFHDTLGILIALETTARIFTALERADIATQLLGALHQNWKSAGLPLLGAPFLEADHQKCVKECQRLMGLSDYDTAFEAGTKLDLDEASALALGELDAPSSS